MWYGVERLARRRRLRLSCGLRLCVRLELVVVVGWRVVRMVTVGSQVKLMRRRHAVNSGVAS